LGGLSLSPGGGDEAARALLSIRGIGPWTAAYIGMRALRAPDAFPEGDLALRRAIEAFGARDVAARAESWRPWRAYAAMYIWTKERIAA
jgi:AraC family transcriptional regulator of adaptative response / DNA-3-methyladenine glycosylase II